jgi:4-aminobutyrate aminotransferase-like enzyme/Ser/Thr protein kinase RdoA (MazF antagonist)
MAQLTDQEISFWQNELAVHWGINAKLTQLNGEYDLNFLASGGVDGDYIFKVMRPDCTAGFVDMQVKAWQHLKSDAPTLPYPEVAETLSGDTTVNILDTMQNPRCAWVVEKLEGRCYADINPKPLDLIESLGRIVGKTNRSLEHFRHSELDRDFKWNLVQADWINDALDCIKSPDRRVILEKIIRDFLAIKPALIDLPFQPIHNDINDYNILVSGGFSEPKIVTGLIDLGDMCVAPRICDLAIAGAYVALDQPNPVKAVAALVKGHHACHPLLPQELDMLWPLLKMRLAVSVVNSTIEAAENPDDPYVTISQAPSWSFLESDANHNGLVRARLRADCNLPVAEGADRVLSYLDETRGDFAQLMGQDLTNARMGSLSVENSTWPQNPFHMPLSEAARVGEEFGNDGDIWLGYYNEPRLIYAEPAFRNGPWLASDRRTVHIAVDGFAPEGTPLFAPLDATVHAVENRQAHLDYGGVAILRHETPKGDSFYTLYGHLNPEVCDRLSVGQKLTKGDEFCRLGGPTQNGGWAPHVHFQLALTTDGMENNWPGVADPDEMDLWRAICPNPSALLNLADKKVRYAPTDKHAVEDSRRDQFSKNLSLTYADPVMLVRGWQHHLFDEWGRPYLDAYNNVPHVGHAHPRIHAVAADQLKRINTNTRYLHPAQTALAEKIRSKLPDKFKVCYFVNSGSEANELALRLARAFTGAKGIVTPDHGYHGNTTGAIDISAYKFNANGGVGQPDWVKLIEVADDYRGTFAREDSDRAIKFANLADAAIEKLVNSPYELSGFIAETFPSVGGQIIPPPGYLSEIYRKVRAAGGICIADEVQTGLGRLGDYYFGFEHQDASPDIVVLGKPIGNGHPIGIVVTTREIADSFAKGPEFFSTFGGSTLSCRIAKEVLDIVDDETLQDNAAKQGARLIANLKAMQQKHECLGDVRGMGLFVGVDLVKSRETKEQASEIASYVKNRMRDHRILIGSEGPFDNILKIRPPLTIQSDDIDMITETLNKILFEVSSYD